MKLYRKMLKDLQLEEPKNLKEWLYELVGVGAFFGGLWALQTLLLIFG